MNKRIEELLREAVEYRAEKRKDDEKGYLALLTPVFATQLKKHKDIVRKLYQELSVDGAIPREELFKYGRDVKLKKAISEVFGETGIKESKLLETTLKKAIQDEYSYGLYTLDVMGANPKRRDLTVTQVNDLVQENWSGQPIREIIKKDKAEQSQRAFNNIVLAATGGLQLGPAIKEVVKQHAFGINKSMLNYQTELTRKIDVARGWASESIDGENQWIILVTLDERTCSQCRPLDQKTYTDRTLPTLPYHPRCRCVKTFYLPQLDFERRARNPRNNRNYLTDDVTYEQWIARISLPFGSPRE